MKEFIVMIALLPLLFFFPSQFVADEINHTKILAFNSIVSKHAQSARVNGCFTTTNINSLKDELSRALYIDAGEITFVGDTSLKYRTDAFNNMQMINYKVSVPIKKFLAMGSFWGVTATDNQVNYSIDGQVASELLP